jgi:hypothetical protein
MDQLLKLKDTVFQYLSPRRSAQSSTPNPKRRRTFGPGTPSEDLAGEHAYAPFSEPRDQKAQAALCGRIKKKYISPLVTTNPRKRGREDEVEEEEVKGEDEEAGGKEKADKDDETDMHGQEIAEVSSLSPEDSPSQVRPNYDEEVEEEEADENKGDEEDGLEEEEEISPQEKVEAYLARQAELVLKRDAIEEVKKQGNWHPAEIFLFERLSLRSFEELLPEDWRIDLRTLPGDIFTADKDKVLINHNCSSAFEGKFYQRL